MHRLRPGDFEEEEAAANPDDLLSDEDLHVTKDDLDDVLETRIGGKSRQLDEDELQGDGHHINSTEAIGLGRDIWSNVQSAGGSVTQPAYTCDEEKVKASLKAAKSSRGKENKFAAQSAEHTRSEREAQVVNGVAFQ